MAKEIINAASVLDPSPTNRKSKSSLKTIIPSLVRKTNLRHKAIKVRKMLEDACPDGSKSLFDNFNDGTFEKLI